MLSNSDDSKPLLSWTKVSLPKVAANHIAYCDRWVAMVGDVLQLVVAKVTDGGKLCYVAAIHGIINLERFETLELAQCSAERLARKRLLTLVQRLTPSITGQVSG